MRTFPPSSEHERDGDGAGQSFVGGVPCSASQAAGRGLPRASDSGACVQEQNTALLDQLMPDASGTTRMRSRLRFRGSGASSSRGGEGGDREGGRGGPGGFD